MKHFLIGNTTSSRIQFFRYLFVGGSAAVVDLIAFTILVKVFGVYYPVAAFFAYMAGLTWNHLLCIFWIFKSRHSRRKEVFIIVMIAVGGLLWTWLILYVFIDIFGFEEVISKMISQVLVLVWNFGMRKLVVFH